MKQCFSARVVATGGAGHPRSARHRAGFEGHLLPATLSCKRGPLASLQLATLQLQPCYNLVLDMQATSISLDPSTWGNGIILPDEELLPSRLSEDSGNLTIAPWLDTVRISTPFHLPNSHPCYRARRTRHLPAAANAPSPLSRKPAQALAAS